MLDTYFHLISIMDVSLAFADPPPLEMATIPPRYFTTADPPKTAPSVIPAYTGKLTGTIITRGMQLQYHST